MVGTAVVPVSLTSHVHVQETGVEQLAIVRLLVSVIALILYCGCMSGSRYPFLRLTSEYIDCIEHTEYLSCITVMPNALEFWSDFEGS